jgi:hypothetical protein
MLAAQIRRVGTIVQTRLEDIIDLERILCVLVLLTWSSAMLQTASPAVTKHWN